jgi:SAM-dependent methyltransferase
MHQSAMANAALFFQTYLPKGEGKVVVEIGSQDVNGSIRQAAPQDVKYIGLDFVEGNGVDVILDDPYKLPFEDGTVDVCVSSSVFEHSEMFWLLYLEILRILKPTGLFYLNVPSNGDFHRFPVDCWRFYPDSGNALVAWAKRNNYSPCLLESFVSHQTGDIWNDFVGVYVKEDRFAVDYPERIIHQKKDFQNGFVLNGDGVINLSRFAEDQKKLIAIKQIVDNQIKVA